METIFNNRNGRQGNICQEANAGAKVGGTVNFGAAVIG